MSWPGSTTCNTRSKYQRRDDLRVAGDGQPLQPVLAAAPQSHEDLKRQRRNSEIWNEESWGQLGRSPDILAPFITGLVAISDALEQVKHTRCNFAENVVNYHRYCTENDLFLTHALGDPQVDRSSQPQNETRAESETEVALHVVEETNAGVIVHGAKQLATAAPISNETYVSLSATFMRRSDPRFILSFSIPTDTPGMKILCREPVSQWVGSYGHPLGAVYDEQDAMLFFDHVLVPWDRIFMLYDSTPLLQRLGSEANFGLGQPLPHSPAHEGHDRGGYAHSRGHRGNRVPRSGRQAGRDGDAHRDVASTPWTASSTTPTRPTTASCPWARYPA